MPFPRLQRLRESTGNASQKLAQMLQQETYYEQEAGGEWMCLNCGYIFKGAKVPPVCPVCRHERGYFIPACMAPYLGFSACR